MQICDVDEESHKIFLPCFVFFNLHFKSNCNVDASLFYNSYSRLLENVK